MSETFGCWGLIPPLLTIVLAVLTKDVIVSLFVGILSGALIIANGNIALGLMHVADIFADSLSDDWNIRIFMFCGLLGALIGLLARTGAALAFGEWASKKIKSKTGTLLFTWFFGLIIFIDDYFNSLTIGTVMRPVTDKMQISRAKLAYILDSTSAPVCIIAPISSWVITVMSYIQNTDGFDKLGVSSFSYFIQVIPYNYYALFAILMVLFITLTHRDFGSMLQSELKASSGEGLFNEKKYGQVSGKLEDLQVSSKGHANFIDMLVPIIILVLLSILFFPITTWLHAVGTEIEVLSGKIKLESFSQAFNYISISDAFNQTDASIALMYGMLITLFITYLYFIFRGLLSIKTASEAIVEGFKSMVPALLVLTLAWSIGSIIRTPATEGGLGLAKFLSEAVSSQNIAWLLPVVVFGLSCVISFSIGSSWGTMGIMVPIVMPIAIKLANSGSPEELLASTMAPLGAVLGGAIFGDHASPISDTTIMSSTGAGCPHLEHVATQTPYALLVAASALTGHLVCGFVSGPWIGFIAAGLVFSLLLAVLGRKRV